MKHILGNAALSEMFLTNICATERKPFFCRVGYSKGRLVNYVVTMPCLPRRTEAETSHDRTAPRLRSL